MAASVGVALFHLLLAYALLSGLTVDLTDRPSEALEVFDVATISPPPPAPEVSHPSRAAGAASPASTALPPITAPAPTRLEVSAPVVATTLPTPPQGSGAAASDGVGAGSGTGGTGTGAGGDGDGSGGIAKRAQRRSGSLLDRDYPLAARKARAEGIVYVRISVGRDGRVSQCEVTRSSGNSDLDATTCRLVERRFRYRPARDAEGRPVADVVTHTYEWRLNPLR
jgi:protein TonB